MEFSTAKVFTEGNREEAQEMLATLRHTISKFSGWEACAFVAALAVCVAFSSAALAQAPPISFNAGRSYPAGLGAGWIAIGAFHGDGKLDLAVVNQCCSASRAKGKHSINVVYLRGQQLAGSTSPVLVETVTSFIRHSQPERIES